MGDGAVLFSDSPAGPISPSPFRNARSAPIASGALRAPTALGCAKPVQRRRVCAAAFGERPFKRLWRRRRACAWGACVSSRAQRKLAPCFPNTRIALRREEKVAARDTVALSLAALAAPLRRAAFAPRAAHGATRPWGRCARAARGRIADNPAKSTRARAWHAG